MIDRDGGGTITVEEMGLLIETLGIKASPEEIKQLVAEIDKDKNGEIDFQGMLNLLHCSIRFDLLIVAYFLTLGRCL